MSVFLSFMYLLKVLYSYLMSCFKSVMSIYHVATEWTNWVANLLPLYLFTMTINFLIFILLKLCNKLCTLPSSIIWRVIESFWSSLDIVGYFKNVWWQENRDHIKNPKGENNIFKTFQIIDGSGRMYSCHLKRLSLVIFMKETVTAKRKYVS